MSSTRGNLGAATLRRTDASLVRALALPRRLSRAAWGAVAIGAAFVATSAWWLSVDRSVPYNDAGQHLYFALWFHDAIGGGYLGTALDYHSYYPPGMYLFGALAAFVGGVSVIAPILAQNLVFVPLLALGCYQLGRLLAGPRAGLLAVVFALGAPLVIEQFHVFMLDMPEAALIAVAAWLILASERFGRARTAALAGLVVGVAIAVKEMAPLYLAGLVVCVLARGGGWRNWRGLAAFGAFALLVGAPWYVRQAMLGHAGAILHATVEGSPASRPPRLSLDNALWYFWATLDGLLFAPLFALATAGVAAAIARVVRSRPREDPTLELLCALGGAWLALTAMSHHDMRYTVGFVPFIAPLAVAWIAPLRPAPRALASAFLAAAALAASIGATLGVGPETSRLLPGSRRGAYGEGVPPRDRVIVYENHNYMVSGPHRHPDVLRFLRGLAHGGITGVLFANRVNQWDRHFEGGGLRVLARVAGLQTLEERPPLGFPAEDAIAIRARRFDGTRPCFRLGDGSGVWLQLGGGGRRDVRSFCPGNL